MPSEYMNDGVLVKFICDLRKYLGSNIEMGIDFLYRWKDPYNALRTLNKLEDCELFFAEAVLQHFNFTVNNSHYFEYLHPDLYDSSLRKDLLMKEPKLEDGVFGKPEEPGLGITLNEQFIKDLQY